MSQVNCALNMLNTTESHHFATHRLDSTSQMHFKGREIAVFMHHKFPIILMCFFQLFNYNPRERHNFSYKYHEIRGMPFSPKLIFIKKKM